MGRGLFKGAEMIYEVLQHADTLQYYVRNRETGRRVVEHVSFAQATLTAQNLEMVGRTMREVQASSLVDWPTEIDIEGTKTR